MELIHDKIRLGLRRFCWLQGLLTSALAVIFLAFFGIKSAYSALLGGSICTFTSWCFAQKMFKFQGAQQSQRIVKSFYRAEGMKMVLTFLLFSLVFLFIPVSAPVFFVSYIMVQALFWVAPQIFMRRI
jgi:ATP synthase protein I